MKSFLFIGLLFGLTLQVTVKDSDQCSACIELKSQSDCENPTLSLGCEWTNSTCSKKAAINYKEYCEQITDPATKCSKTPGCAYIESKCTHFTGCTAYVKTTQSDCQAISYKCTTNGVTCDDVKECRNYSKEKCESSLSINSPYKCKLQNDTCRNYKCTEADISLTTNDQCSQWLSGCVTTGMGCIDKRLPCAQYTGTVDTCSKMIGQDGKCTFDNGTSCRASKCSEIKLNIWDDAFCNDYKPGCKSTGFSCVDNLISCTTYEGNAITCLYYKGSDGQCIYDSTTTKCKAKKCEDKVSGVLSECQTYLPECLTNGVTCVTTLQNCNNYKGTKAICQNIIGLDGKCKGMSDTDTVAACAIKTCADDDLGTETTDFECQTIQNGCKTTGMGCVSTLSSCTNYTDDGNGSCFKMIGSEGKCKGGTDGKCTNLICSDNTTAKTNQECNDFMTGCVTTGTGCAAQELCVNTVHQTTCEGTNSCSWQPICVSATDCSQLNTQSLCFNYKVQDGPCIWENECRLAKCSDFISTDDNQCNTYKTGCISNGTECADPSNCSEFTGTKETCEKFIAYCTNDENAVDNSECKERLCDDSGITATSDSECQAYHPDCLFAGNNQCILKYSTCSHYSGTVEECSKFTGYAGDSPRIKCYSENGSTCTSRQCYYATGMANNSDCNTFLDGCVYNGGDSCVSVYASCSEYKYKTQSSECQQFKGQNGTVQCYDGTDNGCKNKECSDATSIDIDTDQECQSFMSTCVYNGKNGIKCVPNTDECDTYEGTTEQCNKLIRNGKQCSKLDSCKNRLCTDITNAASNNDCMAYLSNCRIVNGTQNCKTSETECTGYLLTSTTNALAYCNNITTTDSIFCAFDSSITGNCVKRNCNLWTSALASTISCDNYIGPNICTLSSTGFCYQIDKCDNYLIPSTVTTGQITWCSNLISNVGIKCTYSTGNKCTAITTCESVPNPSSLQECVQLSQKKSGCLFSNGVCVTKADQCNKYSVTQVAEEKKSAVCAGFNALTLGQYKTQCAYVPDVSTSTCNFIICENIVTPTSQYSCSAGTNEICKYFKNGCFTRKPCANYKIPSSSAQDDNSKRLFCQNMLNDGNNDFCSYDSTANSGHGGCADPQQCDSYSSTTEVPCTVFRDKNGAVCTTDSTQCYAASGDAVCTLVTGVTSNYECDIRTQLGCNNIGGTCQKPPSACNSLPGNNPSTCQSYYYKNYFVCTWLSGDTCTDGQNNCLYYHYSSVNDCSKLINNQGTPCTWKSGNTCSDLSCEDTVNPQQIFDCYQKTSYNCIIKNGSCQMDSMCSYYQAQGDTSADKLAYCYGIVDIMLNQCTYVGGSNCVMMDACNTYYVDSITNQDDRITSCQNVLTTDQEGCTYLNGNKCIKIQDNCSNYSGLGSNNGVVYCQNFKNTAGLTCLGYSNIDGCDSPKVCMDISNPVDQAYCDKFKIGCVYYQGFTRCWKPDTCENYLYYSWYGGDAQSFCQGVKDSSGNYCKATSPNDSNCTSRACNDPETLNFTTNEECITYSNKCKSNFKGCADVTKTCDQFLGMSILNTCSFFLDQTGNNKCLPSSASSISTCIVKTCEYELEAKSQVECDSKFTVGQCRWKNPGCTSSTTPCSNYQGTQIECGMFIGNGKSCWSDSQSKGACRDRTCEDKTIATNDLDCSNFLNECVFNGVGCVSQGSECSAFKGTKDTCSKFNINSAVNPCWSLSTTVGPCINKQCQHLTGTKDSDCEAFLPNNHCITNGTKCVQGPKPCSYFKGDAETCPTFTSSQGICKTGLNGYCAKRECYEAPQNFTSDSQCQDWSPGCYTNGRGCASLYQCTNLQTQTSCIANTNCQWATSCRVNAVTCSSLNGQSICVNNKAKKCAWYNNICRDLKCIDLDSTFNTHKKCNDYMSGCTTTGSGCIEYGVCLSYTTKTICEAAETTESTKKCTWANAQCRIKQCSDFTGTSDRECQALLIGCKSNGLTCIGAPYDCSAFSGNQKLCLQDSQGHPCLYIEGVCYNFYQCSDIQQPSRSFCNSFSSNCVEGVNTCIAINQCNKYTDQVSCYKGINGTICGWLPPAQQQTAQQKCAEFKQCSDAAGTTLDDCIAWNSNCVSDGTNCVTISDCTSYTKEMSCIKDKSNNVCFWTGTTCKIKQCSDVIASTDTECSSNVIKEGTCTTDGTKCVLRSTCKSYTTEASCTVGSDGIPCVYNYPQGLTSGNKYCVPKECTDILGETNDQCIGKINNKPCVSNGKNCVNQGTCSSYKNKLSCDAGGSDNPICVFSASPTTADPLAGTCKPFNSCSDASGDSNICLQNISCKYVEATNKCETTDCTTFNTNGQCNPYPTFDGRSQTLCFMVKNVCTEADPTTLSQGDCYSSSSKYAYTWNSETSKCQGCKGTTSSNTTNQSTNNSQAVQYGYFLKFSVVMILLGTMN